MRRSHLVIENRNTCFFAGADYECGARVRRKHVQQIVVRLSEVSAASLVVNTRDQIDQHLPDFAQASFRARDEEEKQQKAREQTAEATQDRERDRTVDDGDDRNAGRSQATVEAIVFSGFV